MKNPHKTFPKIIKDFIRESNLIEGVTDDDSFDQAMFAWEYLIGQDDLTPSVVLKTHKILMLHQKLQPDQKGYLRYVDVQVGGRVCLHYTAVPYELKQWCAAMNSGNPTHDWKNLHVIYEKIHPFVDGNGRTGRMFMNWHRIKVLNMAPMVLYARERQEYYQWFK